MKPRSFVVWWLLLAIAAPALPAERTPQEQARRIPRGSRIEVELKVHQKVQGRLGEATETQLRLEPLNPGNGSGSTYAFQDVSKVRSIELKQRVWVKALEAPVVVPFRVLEWTAVLVACLVEALAHGEGCFAFGPG
jgi:hypothetical protein